MRHVDPYACAMDRTRARRASNVASRAYIERLAEGRQGD